MYSKFLTGLVFGACSVVAHASCGTTSLSLLTSSITGQEQSYPMTCGSDSKWHYYLTVQNFGQFRLQDPQSVFWGDNQPDGVLDTSGNLIQVGSGTTEVVVDYTAKTYTLESPWKRTVVFMYGQTSTGQDMFLRGGIDHTYAQNNLGRTCTSSNFLCSMPIRHRNLKNATTNPWKTNDNYLDWYGVETGQSTAAQGSPMDWTTDVWPSSWGTTRTVAVDGYGVTPLNTWGQHYWMLDVDMDCSKAVNGWFELKSFISNGPGWEGNVSQSGAPYSSANHFAQCGKINKFERNSSNVLIQDFPVVDNTVLPDGMVYCETGSSCLTQTPIVTLCATGTTNCATAKSTTVRLQINNKTVNLMSVLLNATTDFTFSSNSTAIMQSGPFLQVNGVGQFVLRLGAGVNISSLSYYNQAITWSGDTILNFTAKTITKANGFITLVSHPTATLGTTAEEVATVSQQIYQQEVTATGVTPPAYRAFYSPADVNPMGGDGNFSLGDGTIFMNYGNPPWWAANNLTPLAIMKQEFSHEHQHTIFAANNMSTKVSNDGCLNEGLSDGLGNFLGYVPNSILSAKDNTSYAVDGCGVAQTLHGKGDCVLWHLKQNNFLSNTTFFNLYHPNRNYSLQSCQMTSRTTGNNFVVYLSEATGVDMASFVVGTLKIPAASSLAQAKSELGL